MWLTGIPICPSVNRAYPSRRDGRRFKSSELTKWQDAFMIWSVTHGNREKLTSIAQSLKALPFGFFISVNIVFYFERKRVLSKAGKSIRCDLDNRLKAILDAITKTLGLDDSMIWSINAEKRVALAQPSCALKVETLDLRDILAKTLGPAGV